MAAAARLKEIRTRIALACAQVSIDDRGGKVILALDEAEGGEQYVSIAARHQCPSSAHLDGVMTMDHHIGMWVLYRPNHRTEHQTIELDADPLRSIGMLADHLAPRPQKSVQQRVIEALAA